MTKNLVNPDRSTDFDAKRANHLVNSWPGAKDWCEWDGEQWPCEWVQLYDELVRLRTEVQGFRTYDEQNAVIMEKDWHEIQKLKVENERLREENAQLLCQIKAVNERASQREAH